MRFLLRFLGALALAVAVVFAVLDATRTLAASALVLTPFADAWESAAPLSFARVSAWVGGTLGESVWTGVALPLLSLPGFALWGVLAFLLFALGRPPARPVQPGFGRRRRV